MLALLDALAAGGIPVIVVAAAKYAVGMDVQPLAFWHDFEALRLLFVVIGGNVAHWSLKRRSRRYVSVWTIGFGVLAAVLLYFYMSGANAPANARQPLTWDATLVTLYLGFFGFFGAAFGSIYATVRHRKSWESIHSEGR